MTATTATDMETMLEAALAYAERGWPVLPLFEPEGSGCSCGQECGKAGKHPRTRHGHNDATTDPEKITEWWGEWPEANVGIATGPESGIVVLDVDVGDGKDGLLSLQHFEDYYGPLPDTVQSYTGGGGQHFFFRHPGQPIGSKAGVAPGIDVRADRGYIVAPPSMHPSGEFYIFEATSSPDDLSPADLPDWIKNLATGPRVGVYSRPSVAVGGSIIPKGRRNETLTRIAGAMRGQGCTPEEIQTAIAEVNGRRCSPPLGGREVETIARSIGRYPPSRSTFRGGTYWERAVLEALWDHPNQLRLFTYLVSEATWCDQEGVFSGLEMGQVLTSTRKLANACSYEKNNQTKTWSTSVVDRLLRSLVERRLIEVQALGLGTLITIVDYRQFKGFSAQNIWGLEQH